MKKKIDINTKMLAGQSKPYILQTQLLGKMKSFISSFSLLSQPKKIPRLVALTSEIKHIKTLEGVASYALWWANLIMLSSEGGPGLFTTLTESLPLE
jgi:hypothetical protein